MRARRQECSQFLWACEKAGVSDEPALAAATGERRTRTFAFPPASGVEPVTIAWRPAGRGLAQTGLAPWDALYVLADFLCRHPVPSALPALQQLGAEDSGGCAWQEWRGRSGVELGAGVGLLSIVAARLGVSMVATDGDDAVLELLAENVASQPWEDGEAVPRVRVRPLRWGAPAVLGALGLTRPAGLVLATGVVYGADPEGWAGLVDSLVQLSDEDSLVLLAHGQGAAPGLHRTEGPFFARLACHFHYTALPLQTLHPDYRGSGCVVHALRRRRDSLALAPQPASGLAALDGEQGKRVARAGGAERGSALTKKRKKGDGAKKKKKGKKAKKRREAKLDQ